MTDVNGVPSSLSLLLMVLPVAFFTIAIAIAIAIVRTAQKRADVSNKR
jgi:preprotein translocase subunit SecG